MTILVPPEDLPAWVPGRILLASDGLGWNHVGLRSYHYAGQDVVVPAMRDYLLVGYRQGAMPMQRRFDGRWRHEHLSAGAVSLLTRAQRAYWNWSEPIDVTHIYLSGALVAQVASEAMDCLVTDVTLADVLRTEDEVITRAIEAIAAEASVRALGGAIYVESLARGLIVHLLRRYATVDTRRLTVDQGLSQQQQRRIVDFIDSHLGEDLDLETLARCLELTPCLFARRFRQSFGQPPYAYVIGRRIERAGRYLAGTDLPIKAIAAACGFTDQAHLTRLFARTRGTTPAAFRRQAG